MSLTFADTLRTLEYDKLKDEQRDRIRYRNQLMYTNVAAIAAVVYASISLDTRDLLLALPALGLVMAFWFFDEDRKVVEIRRYLRDLAASVPGDGGPRVLGWEFPTGGGGKPWGRRALRYLVQVGLFVAPGTAAVAWWGGRYGLAAGVDRQLMWAAGVLIVVGLWVAFTLNIRQSRT